MIIPRIVRYAAFLLFISFGKLAFADENEGLKIYTKWCEQCHMDSPFAPGTIQLRQSRGVDKAVILKRDDLNPDYVRQLVRNGFAGMPNFRRTEISDAELEMLIKHLTKR